MAIVEKTVTMKVKYDDNPAAGEISDDVEVGEVIRDYLDDMLPDSIFVDAVEEEGEDATEIEIELDWGGTAIV